MSSTQLMTRLIVGETGLSGNLIRSGKLSPTEWKTLETKTKPLGMAPLYIDDTPALSIFEFRSKVRRLHSNNGIKIIIIDYLQLMTASGQGDKGNREQEVAFISRTLKGIAKELDVPIIALSQLNRATESRGGSKRPQLSDLRESGAIEQDADIVAFIHRPEYYGFTAGPGEEPVEGLAEVIIAKHRNGAVTDVKLRFLKDQAKFTNWDTAVAGGGIQYDDIASDAFASDTFASSASPLQSATGNEFDISNVSAPTSEVPF
jgi:replicative DNA helicase